MLTELTTEVFVNAVFEPQEQVSEVQARLLGATFMLASGGPAQTHVGTGGGGSKSDFPWGWIEENSPAVVASLLRVFRHSI